MGNGLIFPYRTIDVMSDGVTQKEKRARCWLSAFKPVGSSRRKIRGDISREVMTSQSSGGGEVSGLHAAEK